MIGQILNRELNLVVTWVGYFLLFTCLLFIVEISLGVSALWSFIDIFSFKSSLDSFSDIFLMQYMQLMIRYVFLCPLIIWLVYLYLGKNGVQKFVYLFLAFILQIVALFFWDEAVMQVMFLKRLPGFGLSIWFELLVTSALLAFLWKRRIGLRAGSYDE